MARGNADPSIEGIPARKTIEVSEYLTTPEALFLAAVTAFLTAACWIYPGWTTKDGIFGTVVFGGLYLAILIRSVLMGEVSLWVDEGALCVQHRHPWLSSENQFPVATVEPARLRENEEEGENTFQRWSPCPIVQRSSYAIERIGLPPKPQPIVSTQCSSGPLRRVLPKVQLRIAARRDGLLNALRSDRVTVTRPLKCIGCYSVLR